MNDTQEPTAEQKKENIIQALTIAGFTENPEYFGMYARDKGGIREIVDMTAGLSTHLYDIAKKQKILGDDATGTLGQLSQMIIKAEDGQMPTISEPSEVVNVSKKDEPILAPEIPKKDTVDTKDIGAPPEPAPVDNPPAILMPPNVAVDIVRPVVSAAQAIAAWNEFQALQKAILEPSDFQKISGKDFKKKSAWRKFAAFFNLNDKIVEETQTPHADGQGWTWKIKVICTAPNSRFTEGVGMCSTSERNFAHLEHDTYATAHTRAKNRAISDMIAAGEVSAEEVSG